MERYDFKTQRLFVDQDIRSNAEISMDRAKANYLLNVLRMGEDSRVLIFNGRDGEWFARVRPHGRKSCSLVPEKKVRDQTEPYVLEYLFAPLKQARLDYMVQKAVEMGAGLLQPVITHHTQVSKVKTERIASNAIEAAEQCGILTIPEIGEPISLAELLGAWDQTKPLIYCDELAQYQNPVDAMQNIPKGPLAVLIGPEGGFSADERNSLGSLEFVTAISLGPRILRADTAAVAALALVQCATGDWG